MINTQRSTGLDIVRTLAVLLVITTHSIAYLGPMDNNVLSFKWTIYLIIRFTALSCVPLFILLTGYLNRKKKLSAGYYLGILPVVISYVIISALGLIYSNIRGGSALTFSSAVRSILDFSANGYAWYVEMYIGLFLIIPFLNILFDALGSLRNRMMLCVVLCVITCLPQAVESFRVGGVSLDVIPEYWQDCYPITYYFIGAMIGEYQPKLKKRFSIPLALLLIAIPSGLCWLYSSPEEGYAWYMMNGFGCITTGGMAVGLFIALYDIQLPKVVDIVFREFSVCSFEMYLFSYIVDQLIYSGQRYLMPLMVLTVFALSYILARILRLIVVPLYRIIKQKRNIKVKAV